MSAAIRSRQVELAGHSLAILEAGERTAGAPTLLFLHGSGPGVNAASNWTPALEMLGERFHCIAPDVLGFGNSTHPDPAPQGVTAFTEARVASLFQLLDALELNDVVVIGNSMGCVYALEMARERPELVRKVVLMGSGNTENQPKMPGMAKLSGFYSDPTEENLVEMMSMFVFSPESWQDRLQDIAADRLPLAVRADVRRSHEATFAPSTRKFFTEGYLAEVTQPVLVMHGKDDRIVPHSASEFIAAHLPTAHLMLLAQCGHWAQLEYPHLFAGMVAGFIAD